PASSGGCQLAGAHGDVGGTEVDLPGADRGDGRAAAHRGIVHAGRTGRLMGFGEGEGEEGGDVRRPRPGEGARITAGGSAGRGARGRRGGRAGACAGGEGDDRGSACAEGADARTVSDVVMPSVVGWHGFPLLT